MKVIKIIFTALVIVLSLLFYKFLFAPEEVTTIGVIDRIEDARMAVVLIEDDTKQIELTLDELAEDPQEGDVLKIRLINDEYEVIGMEAELTKKRKQEVNKLMQKLRKNNDSSN